MIERIGQGIKAMRDMVASKRNPAPDREHLEARVEAAKLMLGLQKAPGWEFYHTGLLAQKQKLIDKLCKNEALEGKERRSLQGQLKGLEWGLGFMEETINAGETALEILNAMPEEPKEKP